MNFKKLFLVMGLATATMTMSAQSVFDIKLYNGRHLTIMVIQTTLPRFAYSFLWRNKLLVVL